MDTGVVPGFFLIAGVMACYRGELWFASRAGCRRSPRGDDRPTKWWAV